MSLLEAIRTALAAQAANVMRSVLTTLGVVIGVGSVIAMVGLGQGAQVEMTKRISRLGSNLLFVMPGKGERGMLFRGHGAADTLTVEDAQALRKDVPEVTGVAPELSQSVQIKVGTKNIGCQVVGTFSDFAFVRNLDLASGRFFTRLDEEAGRRVAVVGSNVVRDVFGGRSAVGKRLKVKGIPFTVVGTLAPIGGFGRQDEQIIIPMRTAQQRLINYKYVRTIAVSGDPALGNDRVEMAIRRALRRLHRLRIGREDDFNISSQTDVATTMSESNRIFTMLLAGIAAISLVVGGIGIMNIMLVTVTERTREIGIRKALGARRRDIAFQFLIESTVLSVMGGLLGVALGVGIANLLQSKLGLTVLITAKPVLLSFGCAAAIGIFFGWYPARRAAALDPIQALRYE